MSLWTSLEPASTTVDAGSTTTVRLRLRNTGDVVDEYRFVPVGDIAPYVTVEPPTIRLYPGTTGTAQLTFAPPRTPDATAGPHPYAVRITSSEQPEATTVPEGNLTITPFTEIRAELVPHTVKGRLRGRPKLAIDNLGNTTLSASVTGNDSGDELSYDIHPANVQIEPGRAAFIGAVVKPRQIIWFGHKQQRPYRLAVRRSGHTPLDVNGTYVQPGILPRWLATLFSLALGLIIAFIALWYANAPDVTSQAQPLIRQAAASPIPTPAPTSPPTPAPPPTTAAAAPTTAQTHSSSGGGGQNQNPSSPTPTPMGQISGRYDDFVGKCVQLVGDALQLHSCDGGSAQQWSFAANGTIMKNGRCLSLSGRSTDDGTRVVMAACDTTDVMQWHYSSGYDIVNAAANKCLDVSGANTADGTPLQIAWCSGNAAQKWNVPS